MQRDFLAEMNALLNHEKDEIIVEKTEFLDFQKVWVNYNHRKEIVGFAQRNGRVIYRASESGIVQTVINFVGETVVVFFKKW